MIGGRLKLSTQAIIGSESVKQLSQYHFSKAFMGMNGVHHQYGFTTPDEEEATVKATAMRQSSQCFVLADHSKFEALSFSKVANLEEAKIITDVLPKSGTRSIKTQQLRRSHYDIHINFKSIH